MQDERTTITKVEPWLQPAELERLRPVDQSLIDKAKADAQAKIDEITHDTAQGPGRFTVIMWLLLRLHKIIGLVFKIRGALKMGDLKTTVTGLVGALSYLLAIFGLHLPQDVGTGIVAVTVFLVGLFAKDSSKPQF